MTQTLPLTPSPSAPSSLKDKLPCESRYEVLHDLSLTLFGSIKLAKDKVSGNTVAVKITDKSLCNSLRSSNIGILDDWKHELAVMKSLQVKFLKDVSPPVVEYVDFFEDESHACLVMEYVPLGDLYHYLSRKKLLAETQAKKLFFQVVKSVRKLHIAGYAHLDISLENIMLGNKGNVKLCDLAVASEIRTSPATRKGELIASQRHCTNQLPFKPGKEMYRAPELNHQSTTFSIEEVNGIAADTYSLGVVLFCILYGFNPYKVASKEEDSVYSMITDEGIQLTTILEFLEVKNEVSEDAENLLSQMLCPVQSRIPLKQVLEHSWFKKLM
jgi:serine/threonine protein kinase